MTSRRRRAAGTSLSEWVRRALREARRRETQDEINRKREVIRTAVLHGAPTADIEQMLAEIEQGYTGSLPE